LKKANFLERDVSRDVKRWSGNCSLEADTMTINLPCWLSSICTSELKPFVNFKIRIAYSFLYNVFPWGSIEEGKGFRGFPDFLNKHLCCESIPNSHQPSALVDVKRQGWLRLNWNLGTKFFFTKVAWNFLK